jgi:membrane-associated HD superfamily phosphohydrolase
VLCDFVDLFRLLCSSSNRIFDTGRSNICSRFTPESVLYAKYSLMIQTVAGVSCIGYICFIAQQKICEGWPVVSLLYKKRKLLGMMVDYRRAQIVYQGIVVVLMAMLVDLINKDRTKKHTQ